VPLRITRPICALALWPVLRLRGDPRAASTGTLAVPVNVINEDDETRARDAHRPSGTKPVLRRDAMQPNRGGPGTDLRMHRLACGLAFHAPSVEAERVHEAVVGRGDVLGYQERDGAVESGQTHLLVVSAYYLFFYSHFSIIYKDSQGLSFPKTPSA
jgi:hypothetical protein